MSVLSSYWDLIGVPFEYGGRGPDTFDCYGLLMEVHRRCGIELPDYHSPSRGDQITAIFMGELWRWKKVERGQGATALYRIPGNLHCAYLLNRDTMLHTWEHTGGVLTERVDDWERKLIGYYVFAG